MAFKISLSPTYTSKVAVETPNINGKVDKSDFMAEFRRVGMDEIDELRKLPQAEVLRKVLVGWTALIDDEKQDVPFSETNRDLLLQIPQALIATAGAFWESVSKGKEKNS